MKSNETVGGQEAELLTLKGAAALLAVSLRTVEALVGTGALRSAIMPGTIRARRVSRQMIAEYVQAFNGSNRPHAHARKRAKR